MRSFPNTGSPSPLQPILLSLLSFHHISPPGLFHSLLPVPAGISFCPLLLVLRVRRPQQAEFRVLFLNPATGKQIEISELTFTAIHFNIIYEKQKEWVLANCATQSYFPKNAYFYQHSRQKENEINLHQTACQSKAESTKQPEMK